MRQKYILFLLFLAVIALTACGVDTEQAESADNMQTEEQISGPENVNFP